MLELGFYVISWPGMIRKLPELGKCHSKRFCYTHTSTQYNHGEKSNVWYFLLTIALPCDSLTLSALCCRH